MKFNKVDCKAELDEMIKEDPEIIKYVEEIDGEFWAREIIVKAKRVRKAKGITQEELAKISGLTQQMVSRIESFENLPTLDTFMRYLNALGLTLEVKEI